MGENMVSSNLSTMKICKMQFEIYIKQKSKGLQLVYTMILEIQIVRDPVQEEDLGLLLKKDQGNQILLQERQDLEPNHHLQEKRLEQDLLLQNHIPIHVKENHEKDQEIENQDHQRNQGIIPPLQK